MFFQTLFPSSRELRALRGSALYHSPAEPLGAPCPAPASLSPLPSPATDCPRHTHPHCLATVAPRKPHFLLGLLLACLSSAPPLSHSVPFTLVCRSLSVHLGSCVSMPCLRWTCLLGPVHRNRELVRHSPSRSTACAGHARLRFLHTATECCGMVSAAPATSWFRSRTRAGNIAFPFPVCCTCSATWARSLLVPTAWVAWPSKRWALWEGQSNPLSSFRVLLKLLPES